MIHPFQGMPAITIVGQRKQMAKMMVVVMFPLAILTAITAVDFSKSLTRYINTDAVMDRLNFGIELGYFLTSLVFGILVYC
jgi:hypothetical protein